MATPIQYTVSPSTVLFCDADYVKQTTSMNADVEEGLIRTGIVTCQDKYILPAMGSSLFEDLKSQIVSNNLSSDYEVLLLNYIRPALAFSCISEIIPMMVFRLQNKGLEIKHSENSNSPSIEQMDYLRNHYTSTGQYYLQRLSQFLKDQYSQYNKYPLYYNNGVSGIDVIQPNATSYQAGGLYIPGLNTGGLGLGGLDTTGWGISREPGSGNIM